MAIETLNTVLDNGITVPTLYNRVEVIQLQKNSMRVKVRQYVDTTKPYLRERHLELEYNITGENPIKQAYEYLKTLPEFADAVDC
jgi:hypothetical protein